MPDSINIPVKAAQQKQTNKKQYSAPALEKGLDILELLSSELNGLNISEITERLDRTVGEVFRMIAVLEQRGYLELPQSTDRYRVTIKLFRLANQFPPVKRLAAIARPIMQNLAFNIEQSCHLVIYYEGKGHVVVQQDSLSERNFSVNLGTEVSLMNTCSGHVLLTFSAPQTHEIMVRKIPNIISHLIKTSLIKLVKKSLNKDLRVLKVNKSTVLRISVFLCLMIKER